MALARALYGDPALVVLDEPDANLDTDGEHALAEALRELAGRSVTVLMVTHNVRLLRVVDHVLVLREGSAGGGRRTRRGATAFPAAGPGVRRALALNVAMERDQRSGRLVSRGSYGRRNRQECRSRIAMMSCCGTSASGCRVTGVTRIGIAVLVVALGGFGAWASLVPLTEGVVATGSVVVDTAHKTIQHLEGGIVEKLYVREGSEVMAGDVLIKLSETQTRAELELLESRYYGRRAEIDRLNAERVMGEEIVFSEELLARRDEPQIADVLAMQRDLFEVRRRQYQGQIKILRHRIEQLEEKIRGLKASRKAGVREQALIEKDLKSSARYYTTVS